ncbi:MAG: zinc ribbon domain-containing protein [Gammaproteobacteria bacterium]|nr:zinc ribbon domain-containing protein [Gammaproteobacteria bacterium]
MPFYEYECSHCKYAAEVLQKISDAPMKKCPSCGRSAFKRLVSAPVFRLKGSGWYETDFKSDKEGKRNLVGTEREEPKGESAAESKPAETAKAEPKPGESKPGESKSAESKPGQAARATSAARKAAPGVRAGAKRAAPRRAPPRVRGRRRGG